MKAPQVIRRATLLGIMVTLSACDVAQLVTDPAPRFEQTWNLPVSADTITIKTLLPTDNSVTVLPDSSGFSLKPASVNINEVVGPQCPACMAKNGTTDFKPQFQMVAANSSALATDVTSADIQGGSVNVTLTNNMSFDPLRVKTVPGATPQGYMIILIHSGSIVFGRDSVNGATTSWQPGSQLNRVISLGSGTAAGQLAVDVTLNSPQGDSLVFIDASGTLTAAAVVTSLTVARAGMNVVNRQMSSESADIDLAGLDQSLTDHVVRGSLLMTITNPLSLNGNINIRFAYGALPAQAVNKSITLPTGVNQLQVVSLDSAEMHTILGNKITVNVGGLVNSSVPQVITPRLRIVFANRMVLTIRTGGGQ